MNNETTPKVKVKGHAAYMVVFDWSVDVRFLILPLVKCGNENCSKLLMILVYHRDHRKCINPTYIIIIWPVRQKKLA